MKIILALVINNVSSQTCSSIRTRPEIKSLSNSQFNDYVNCIKKLMNATDSNSYSGFTSTHWNNVPQAHNVPAFLPWHRYFLYTMQRQFDQACGGNVVVPYWDWSQDYSNLLNSPVMSSSKYGGGGGAQVR